MMKAVVSKGLVNRGSDVLKLMSRSFGGVTSDVLTTKHLSKMQTPFQPSKSIPKHFQPINEVDVTREMIDGFSTDWKHASHSDILIVGAGLTGLVAAYQLSKIEGLKVTIVDKQLHPGGSIAVGSQFFNTVVIRKPAHQILLELEIPFTEKETYVTVRNPSNLISALLNKTLNHAKSEFVFLGNLDVADYLFRGSECCGISCGFGSTSGSEEHTFGSSAGFNKSAPFPFYADIVISACGARSSYSRLRNLGWIDPYYNYSADSMDMNIAEDSIVHHTRVVAPSLIMGGTEIAYLDGLHLPGPTSGCLIQSGWKASSLAMEALNEHKDRNNLKRIGMEAASHFIGSKV